jgi:hypothetical protein
LNQLKRRTVDIFQALHAKKDKIDTATRTAEESLAPLYKEIVHMRGAMNLRTLQEMMNNDKVFKAMEAISWVNEDERIPEDLNPIALFEGIVGDFVARQILAKGRECCGICFGEGLPALLKRLESRRCSTSITSIRVADKTSRR